jgi:hypothetical protein
MRGVSVFAIVLFAVVALLPGCATLEEGARGDELNRAAKQYAAAMRWGQYAQAYALHGLRDGELAAVDFDALKTIRVTQYHIRDVVIDEGALEGRVLVEFGYYDEYVGAVRSERQSQVWWYDESIEAWRLDAQFPTLK